MSTPPVVLAIGGSDSSAGAGIQADLKAITAAGGYAVTAITAVTAQSTLGVQSVHAVPVETVVAQIRAVLEDMPVAAVKTGFLGRAEVVRHVAATIPADLPLVVDPVLVDSVGHQIVDHDTLAAYQEELDPVATVLTPNFREAALLTGIAVVDVDTMVLAARALAGQTDAAILVTGGHLDSDDVADVSVIGGAVRRHVSARIDSANVHGTGCSTASSLATHLAAGRTITEAVDRARNWVNAAIAGAADWRLGAGQGGIAPGG